MAEPSNALEQSVVRFEALIRDHIRARIPHADVFSFGAIDLSPSNLAIWVKTRTDEEKSALYADAALQPKLRELLREAGYPRKHIDGVGFAFQSQESVDRDYEGSWWLARK